MLPPPIRLTRSLGLAWALAGQRARRLSEALGLGPIAICAFLPRKVHRLVTRELTALEALVRRILFLVAMSTPLPRWKLRGAGPASARREADAAGPPPRAGAPLFPVPAFRLTESPGRAAQQAGPCGRRPPSGPAFPREPGDPPFILHELPAAGLFNRFAALRAALDDPEGQVARLRRKLARIRADRALPLPLADVPPAACTGPDTPPVWREIHWTLHDAALSWLPRLDTG